MTDKQTIKKENTKLQVSGARKDLVIILIISIFVFILSYFFDVFVFIVRFIERYPHTIIYIDEIITGLLTLSIGFAIFSWRRWRELKEETRERIRLQEELLRMAKTQAETERIISKQLRSEIELRKQEGRNALPHSPKAKRWFKQH